MKRRQILSSLGAILLLSPRKVDSAQDNAGDRPDLYVSWTEIPKELGCGFLSTTNQILGVLVETNGRTLKRNVQGSPYFSAKLVDTRSAFLEQISGSIDASARFGGGGASASASMSKSFRQSEVQTSLLVQKTVVTTEYFIKGGNWTGDARETAERDQLLFMRRFGDLIVDSVKVGGRMVILYTFTFSSREEAERFSGEIDGSYGSVTASAKYQRSMFKKAQNSSMNVSGFVVGANGPRLEVVDTTIDGKGNVKNPDRNLQNILDFYSTFEDKVRVAGSQEPVELGVVDSVSFSGAVPVFNLSAHRRHLKEAIEVYDAIDERRSELAYLKNVAFDWNKHVSDADINEIELKLERLEDKLDGYVENIRSLNSAHVAEPSVSTDEIPSLPNGVKLKKLVRIAPYSMKISNKSKDTEKDFVKIIKLPLLNRDSPMRITMSLTLSNGGVGRIRIDLIDKYDGIVSVVFDKGYTGPHKEVASKKQAATTHFAIMNPNCLFVRLSLAVSGGTMSASGEVFA